MLFDNIRHRNKGDLTLKRKFTKIVAVLLALLMLPSVSLYSAVDFSGIFSFKAKASGSEFLKSGFCGDTSDGTDDVSRFRMISIPISSDGLTFYRGGNYSYIYFWEHVTSRNVDNPSKRPGQLIKTQQTTMNILRRYYNSYSDLF